MKKMKKKDLQPWLDYFSMLRSYEQRGYLEMVPGKGEAYITQPALHALSEGDDPVQQAAWSLPATVRNLRTYAGWRSQEGPGYLKKTFAVHVVKEQSPHDLLYTVLLTTRRHWWWPFRKLETMETIKYC